MLRMAKHIYEILFSTKKKWQKLTFPPDLLKPCILLNERDFDPLTPAVPTGRKS